MDDGADDEMNIDDGNDENDEAKKKSEEVVYDSLIKFLEPISKLLGSSNESSSRLSTFMDQDTKNLGVLKLRAIELLASLTQLRHTQFNEELVKLPLTPVLLDLVRDHPWNNFVQLKVHQVFTDYLGSENTAE